jgi:hypothetical protein
MTTATAVINGNTIEADLETIAKILSVVSNTITSVSDNSDTKEDESDEVEYINWDTFVENETKKLLIDYYKKTETAESRTKHLISSLKFCRRYADYRMLIPTYHYFGASENPKIRQFLKLVSACDRIVHFTNSKYRHYTNNQLSTLRSEIKYARMCPECGSIANKFWDRVMKDPNVTV